MRSCRFHEENRGVEVVEAMTVVRPNGSKLFPNSKVVKTAVAYWVH